jgi:tetratricopeptide (TPR) repeat protein
VLWDDQAHLTRAGLQSVAGLGRIWFDIGATQQYYPMVHSTFWMLHRFAGDETLLYHLVTIALHAGSAFLVAVILVRLGVPGAPIAATIFALHPIQVESVAWMTELKNTLSGFLMLGAALAYLGFDETRRGRPYIVALALFVLALLSKSVTAVLPAALLVVFWWRRGSIAWRRDVVPLAPFFATGLAAGLTTAWFERVLNGARGLEYQLGPMERMLVAGRALCFYAWTAVWPAHLSFIYGKWTIDAREWWQYLFPAAVVAAIAGLWLLRARSRSPLAAALLFCGALAPALGFVDVYPFRYSYVANHFAYLAMVPFAALAGAGLARLGGVWPAARARSAPAVAIGVVLAALTWNEARAYADSNLLYQTTLARNPDCWLCHNNLATPHLNGSPAEIEEAAAHLLEALRLNPAYAEAHNNLGGVLQRRGDYEAALREHTEAFRLSPDLVEAIYNVALCEQTLGRTDQAIGHYADAVRLAPDYALAHYSFATALHASGRFAEAVREYRATLSTAPDSADAHCGLGISLAAGGSLNDAGTELRDCVRRAPGSAMGHDALASVLAASGAPAEAISEYREALRLQPASAPTHYKLAICLAGSGRVEEAVTEFRDALKYDPGSAEAHHDLGSALANLGRLPEAMVEFREALRLRPEYEAARADLARAQRLTR